MYHHSLLFSTNIIQLTIQRHPNLNQSPYRTSSFFPSFTMALVLIFAALIKSVFILLRSFKIMYLFLNPSNSQFFKPLPNIVLYLFHYIQRSIYYSYILPTSASYTASVCASNSTHSTKSKPSGLFCKNLLTV